MAYQPKSYKKFVATAATATLVASAIVPVASAATFTDVNSNYTEAVNYLVANKIAQGTSETTFGTTASITRGDAAVMIANALELNTSSAPDAGFKDLNTRVAGAVNALFAAKIIGGKSATSFAPDDKITRQEMAKVISLAYELDNAGTNNTFVDVNSNWDTYVDALVKNKVTLGKTPTTFGATQNVTRGEFALFVFRAETLVPATPEVVSVSAINAKEIVVEFNSAVDKVTAEAEANYSLKVAGTTISSTNFTAEVDEDNAKKVILTLADASKLSNDAAVQLTVSKEVLNTNLVPAEADYSKTWVFSDKTAATITKVVKDGNNIKVTFDDYVSAVELVKVNGVDKTTDVVVASPSSKTITITNGAAGLVNGTYTVLVSGVTDLATNKSSVLTSSVVVTDDAVAPSVSKVEQTADNTLKVKFNKDVTGASFVVKKNGYNVTVTATPLAGPEDEYVLTLADNGLIKVYDDGQSTSAVTLEVTGFKAANNLYGTAFTSAITLNKDKTAPTTVSRFNEIVDLDAAATSNEYFDIRFNEDINTAVLAKVTLTDKDGVRQAVDSATIVNDSSNNPTILRVKATSVETNGAIKVGSYKINLAAGAVKDASGNDNAATTVTLVKSSAAADVTATATATANDIEVQYGTNMSTSAVSSANYLLDGKALPAGTNIYFDGNTTKVIIELPAGSVTSTGGAVLSISDNVVSTAGSKVATANRTQNITTGFEDNVKPVLVSAKKATDTTIELTFSEVVDGTATGLDNDFIVKINGTTVTATVTDGTAGDNKLTLTVPQYNTAQAVTVSATTVAADVTLADAEGNTLTLGTTVTSN